MLKQLLLKGCLGAVISVSALGVFSASTQATEIPQSSSPISVFACSRRICANSYLLVLNIITK